MLVTKPAVTGEVKKKILCCTLGYTTPHVYGVYIYQQLGYNVQQVAKGVNTRERGKGWFWQLSVSVTYCLV